MSERQWRIIWRVAMVLAIPFIAGAIMGLPPSVPVNSMRYLVGSWLMFSSTSLWFGVLIGFFLLNFSFKKDGELRTIDEQPPL